MVWLINQNHTIVYNGIEAAHPGIIELSNFNFYKHLEYSNPLLSMSSSSQQYIADNKVNQNKRNIGL